MTNREKEAKPAVKKLLRKDEDQLYKELAMRKKTLKQDPSMADSFDLTVKFDIAAMGPMDELRDFGQELFNEYIVAAHKLFCGKETADNEDREKLKAALGLGDAALAAVLASLLVGYGVMAAALAAVVAAILIKRFAHTTYEVFCKAWTKNLPEG